jgi:membrane-bound serine protease (ClpP class)
VEEKTVSFVRKVLRATAESRKRPPLAAAAMVDPDVEIRGLIQKGKLLTFPPSRSFLLHYQAFRGLRSRKAFYLSGGERTSR